jgi:hypothetical protein
MKELQNNKWEKEWKRYTTIKRERKNERDTRQ